MQDNTMKSSDFNVGDTVFIFERSRSAGGYDVYDDNDVTYASRIKEATVVSVTRKTVEAKAADRPFSIAFESTTGVIGQYAMQGKGDNRDFYLFKNRAGVIKAHHHAEACRECNNALTNGIYTLSYEQILQIKEMLKI